MVTERFLIVPRRRGPSKGAILGKVDDKDGSRISRLGEAPSRFIAASWQHRERPMRLTIHCLETLESCAQAM